MKRNNIIRGLLFTCMVLVMVACSDSPERDPSPVMSPNCNGVYFEDVHLDLELDPAEPTQISINISREKTTEAITVPIIVLEDRNDVYTVPESVSFAAGQETVTMTINFPDAPLSVPHQLSIALCGEDVDVYSEKSPFFGLELTRIKWDNIGTGYIVTGVVSRIFNVDPDLACAVEIEKAELPTSTRYRFNSPYAKVATSVDELGGYDGYPYNEEEDLVPGTYVFIIEVTDDGASLPPTDMGMDWGYGMFSCGSVYGFLSDNLTTYPLGSLNDAGDVITFPVNSLYSHMPDFNDGTYYPNTAATTIYLSKDAYANR